jgi:hypothetical protein
MSRIDVEQAVAHIVALQLVAGAVDDPVERRRLERVVRELSRSLGVGVAKRPAAAVLGMTVQALDRWIARGVLPVVRKPRSSRELIDSRALLVLAEEVTRLREAGQTRALLATAFRELERTGRLPRRLRPNESAHELREDYLNTTPTERLRDVAELSYAVGVLAGHGDAARKRSQ